VLRGIIDPTKSSERDGGFPYDSLVQVFYAVIQQLWLINSELRKKPQLTCMIELPLHCFDRDVGMISAPSKTNVTPCSVATTR
jgi:hypothetical protein